MDEIVEYVWYIGIDSLLWYIGFAGTGLYLFANAIIRGRLLAKSIGWDILWIVQLILWFSLFPFYLAWIVGST